MPDKKDDWDRLAESNKSDPETTKRVDDLMKKPISSDRTQPDRN